MCISYARCFWSRKSCYHIVRTPPKIVLILKQNNFAFNKFGINFTNLTKVSELRYAFLYFFRQPVFTLAWKHEEWDNLAIFNPLWSSPTPKQTNESATANEKAWCTLYNSTDTNLQITFFPREKTKNFISGTKEKKEFFKGFWLGFYYLKKEGKPLLVLQYRRFYLLQLGQFSLLRQSFLFPLWIWNMLCHAEAHYLLCRRRLPQLHYCKAF